MKTKRIFKTVGIITLIAVIAFYWKLILHNLILLAIAFWIVRWILRLLYRLLPLCITGVIIYLLMTY